MTHARASSWIPLLLLAIASHATARPSAQNELAAYGCAACHTGLRPGGLREAPNLSLTVPLLLDAYLEAYIADPHSSHEGSRMPHLLGILDDAERDQAARELAAFLRSAAAEAPAAAAAEGTPLADPKAGERIYHRIGCVMCHGARAPSPGSTKTPQVAEGMRDLGHISQKYTANGLAAFLIDPLAHRPAGLMPDMQLSRSEANDLAAYLAPGNVRESPKAPGDAEVAALREAGKVRFKGLGCANCHGGLVDEPAQAYAGPAANTGQGCLSEQPAAGVPHYRFDAATREALRTEISRLGAPRSSSQRIDRTLGAFRCTACHVRDDGGGVPMELDGYLATDEPDLGDHARRPPRLTGVGGKLRTAWLERVLFDGASVRPYMGARMPIFGEHNVAHLPALFAEVDGRPELTFPKPEGEEKRAYHDAAREMLGTTSLGCVTCHKFNAKPAPTFQGIDLVTSPERLQERWFRDFLIAPQELLPGVVMPESWPGGVALHDTLLDGDTTKQINAIWDYLTLGRSARDPKGIAQPRWDVDVGDRPKVYRGRSGVAGFRGIAVGFPEGIHYAFDANNGALAAIWRGDFVSVNWNGQGAGDFNPRSRPVELPRDVALLERIPPDDPWPLRPTMTKEKPINPDPTYPRQHGYGFRGYHLGPDGTPTMRYAMRRALVEDRLTPMEFEGRLGLVRTLRIGALEPMGASFRVLAGDIKVLGPGRYRAGGITVTASGLEPRLRAFGDGQELLIDLELSKGLTQLELTYEFVD